MKVLGLICLLLIVSSSKIYEITASNFKKLTEDPALWFVQVANDRCPQCINHDNELNSASVILQGIVRVAKVSSKLFQTSGHKVIKNPSYILFKTNSKDVVEYTGTIDDTQISKFCFKQIKNILSQRNKRAFQSGSAKNSNKQSSKSSQAKMNTLTDETFQSNVIQSSEAWFVLFYSPSCGHCHAMMPQWQKLPSIMGSKVNIAKIDATKNGQMAQKYQIKGFPTLIFFDNKDKSKPIPYNGERTASAFESWLKTQSIGQQKVQIQKLTKETYELNCNKNIICLIFLAQKKSQIKNLDFLETIMEKNTKLPFKYFYSGPLTDFEQALMIEDREYPKLAVIWDSINSYRVFNDPLTQTNLEAYLNKIMERRAWIKFSQPVNKLLFSQVKDQL